jgi:hypothetical protein
MPITFHNLASPRKVNPRVAAHRPVMGCPFAGLRGVAGRFATLSHPIVKPGAPHIMTRDRDVLDAATEGPRSPYLFDTKTAAEAVGCHPNKFGDWWMRTEDKLERLGRVQRVALAQHLIKILARYGDDEKGGPK